MKEALFLIDHEFNDFFNSLLESEHFDKSTSINLSNGELSIHTENLEAYGIENLFFRENTKILLSEYNLFFFIKLTTLSVVLNDKPEKRLIFNGFLKDTVSKLIKKKKELEEIKNSEDFLHDEIYFNSRNDYSLSNIRSYKGKTISLELVGNKGVCIKNKYLRESVASVLNEFKYYSIMPIKVNLDNCIAVRFLIRRNILKIIRIH